MDVWKAHNDYVSTAAEIDSWRQGSATRAAVMESFQLQEKLLRARVAEEHAEGAYLEIDQLRQDAERAGHHLSIAARRRWQRARNRMLAIRQQVHALRQSLAAYSR